jgi:hypothetical protein
MTLIVMATNEREYVLLGWGLWEWTPEQIRQGLSEARK